MVKELMKADEFLKAGFLSRVIWASFTAQEPSSTKHKVTENTVIWGVSKPKPLYKV
jgi:hypothetical protein